jgi:hypothetical protein
MSWKGIGQFKSPQQTSDRKINPLNSSYERMFNTKILSTKTISYLDDNEGNTLEINAPSIHLNTNQLLMQNENVVLEEDDLHVNTNVNSHFYGNTFLDCPRFKCFTLANTPQVILNNDVLMQSSFFFIEYKLTSRVIFLKSDLATYNPVDSNEEDGDGTDSNQIYPSFYTHKITFLLQKASKHPHELPEIRVIIQTPVENIIVKFDSPSSSLELLWHPAGEWKVLGVGFKTIIES